MKVMMCALAGGLVYGLVVAYKRQLLHTQMMQKYNKDNEARMILLADALDRMYANALNRPSGDKPPWYHSIDGEASR